MSQENVDVLEACIDAFGRGDLDALLRHVDENVVWIAARSAVEGTYHGHEGLRKFFADTAESFAVFELDVREIRDLGERILVLGTIRVRGRGGSVETIIPMAGVCTFTRSGKLARWEDFRDRQLALEAVGLSG